MLRTARSADGTPIAFEERGRGPGLPVVLVHAAGLDRGAWGGVTKLLATAGHRVAAMDRRGRGASGDGAEHSLAREAEDVLAVARAMTAEGDGRVAVVGHSFGALVALEAATLAPEAVSRLVVYEPPIPVEPEVQVAVARMLAHLDRGEEAQAYLTWLRDVARYPRREVAPLEADPEGVRAAMAHERTLAREMRAAMAYRPDPARLAAVGMPALVMHGAESPPLFIAASRAVHAHLPRSTLRPLEGQGHNAVMQAPGVVAETVAGFLAER